MISRLARNQHGNPTVNQDGLASRYPAPGLCNIWKLSSQHVLKASGMLREHLLSEDQAALQPLQQMRAAMAGGLVLVAVLIAKHLYCVAVQGCAHTFNDLSN